MDTQIKKLEDKITSLEERVKTLEYHDVDYDMPYDVRTNLQKAVITDVNVTNSTLTFTRDGVLYIVAFSSPANISGVYYVADSSGGAVTRKLTFTNGVLTSQT